MSKIRTLEALQLRLDNESSWRIKEISTLKILVNTSNSLSKKTAVRASIAVLYAHWEGFIKNSATMYLNYVNSQRLKYCDLESCFVVFGIKKTINELNSSLKSELQIKSLDFIRNEMNNIANLKFESAIRTESNLNSDVFKNIISSIGFDSSKYRSRYKLIDESLLQRRNCIAHGEYIDVNTDEFRGLADEVLTLLRMFKTDVENAASLERYKLNSI